MSQNILFYVAKLDELRCIELNMQIDEKGGKIFCKSMEKNRL